MLQGISGSRHYISDLDVLNEHNYISTRLNAKIINLISSSVLMLGNYIHRS